MICSSLLLILSPFLFSCSDDDGDQPGDNNSKSLSDAEHIATFPASHPLNEDVSTKNVDANSSVILNNIGLSVGLFPDFGSGTYEGKPIGIPYTVVSEKQTATPITYRANDYDGNYGDESDEGPFPIPPDAPIEGNGEGDSHVISVDVDNGMLYELYNASRSSNGWEASSGAVFYLNQIEYRPATWTSADAAGLPIFPLLVRHPEIEENGEIDHAIRFTLPKSKIYGGYVHPARHKVSDLTGNELLPFGAKLRLKADYDISGYSETNQAILQAMKKYGLILADVGSSMFISGAPHEEWDNDDLKGLRNVKVSDFEVVEMGEVKTY
ncbi:hypothetical protein JMN32_13290 [Fulvivirga sp. 29W222]|uniref:Uncharacterized protein n=2 Tax=Fulvivirga marina TaxID=2494733 RepID=A0A937KC98_9BACT|nr:hypothetical protein [Fulvivirga marina]